MNWIIDTHAHYDDKSFSTDRQSLLSSMLEKGVLAIINVATEPDNFKDTILLTKEFPFIFAALGVHPLNLKNIKVNYLQKIDELISKEKVVAIGEIGLDYHYDSTQALAQQGLFEAQLKLALKHNLPVIVHDREAHEDALNFLKKYEPRGVVHCFSGDLNMANELIEIGMYIGFGGVVTFKNAKNTAEVVKNIPIEKILLETDAPYMAPVPFRGQRCDSSMISYTASKIAEIRGIPTEELLHHTKKNACELFSLQNIIKSSDEIGV